MHVILLLHYVIFCFSHRMCFLYSYVKSVDKNSPQLTWNIVNTGNSQTVCAPHELHIADFIPFQPISSTHYVVDLLSI